MTISEAVDKFPIGTIVYVIKELNVKWATMRFENTNIVCVEYMVSSPERYSALFGTHATNVLSTDRFPRGAGNYNRYLERGTKGYLAFKTREEAEIYKILELTKIEEKVNEYIDTLKKKSENKIKQIKKIEKLSEYLEKYPEVFLKVMG